MENPSRRGRRQKSMGRIRYLPNAMSILAIESTAVVALMVEEVPMLNDMAILLLFSISTN